MPETERIIETQVDENAWRQHIARYEFAREYVANKSILDVACGTGYGTYFLAGSCQKSITGVDVSSDAVAYAKTHYIRPGLEYHLGDALDLARYRGVEAVVSLETIEHLQEPEKFLAEVVRTLVPGGTFVVSTPNRSTGRLSDKPRNPFHIREWNIPEFRDLLTRYFEEVDLYDQFLYVGKKWYPGSRMISEVVLKAFYRDRLAMLHKWEVSPPDHSRIPLVKLIPRYVVAVCAKRRK